MSYAARRKRFEIEQRKSILEDKELSKFLSHYLTKKKDRVNFISRCLRKQQTKRMLLRLHWYVDIAKNMKSVRLNRVSLQIIFLMAMAETLARSKVRNSNLKPKVVIFEFFKEILLEDRELLRTKFRRSLAAGSYSNLSFKSIINILYQVRNDAVHGVRFWNFFLADEDDVQKGMTLMTWGYLGPQGRKRREVLELTLTFQELVDVFVRTGLENIRVALR